jgi:large subunit ribosomal protein L10
MSKKVKNLIEKELITKFSPLDGLAVISPQGIDGTKSNQLRRRLGAKGLKMTVVKNTLARRAAAGTKLKGFDKLLDGPSAVIYGKSSISSIARMLIEERKLNEKLELRGVFFDGEIYPGEKGVEQVSKLPTREEAIASIVGSILGPGRKLAAAIKGPGSKIGGILKTIEDKAKEKEPAAAVPSAGAPAAG